MSIEGEQIGFDNEGQVVAKNRAYRRKRITIAELDNLPKKFYTKSKKNKRKKHGAKKH